MSQVMLEDYNSQLARLVQQASEGEEVIILRDSTPVAKIVSLLQDKPHPQFGSGKDKLIYMADDFDAATGRLRGIHVMRVLLDTHTFLWFVFGSANLSTTARTLIQDPLNQRLLSIASPWEVSIKVSSGKLAFSQSVDEFLPMKCGRTSSRCCQSPSRTSPAFPHCHFIIVTPLTGS